MPATLQIPVLLKDHEVDASGFAGFELRSITVPSLLPGPVSDRVAIVDLRGGVLFPACPLPTRRDELLPRTAEPQREPGVVRWSVFATVLEILRLFEAEDCLGRTIPWAFGRDQLLVVPEAGDDANAFYDRRSGSLQLYWFTAGNAPSSDDRILAAASQDIVTHETAHAVLDGIAPWLNDASGPESLALHESIADLTALFASASSPALAREALQLTAGDIGLTPVFSGLAPEFGRGIAGHPGPLRDLVDEDAGHPLACAAFGPGGLEPEPHDLSIVLSRAFYALVLDVYSARLADPALILPPNAAASDVLAHAGAAFTFAVNLVKRLLFRGLDYLPPADAGFVDLARAVLACDRAAHPDDVIGVRARLVHRLVERGVGADAAALDTPFHAVEAAFGKVSTLALGSTWFAMRLVEQHRDVLGIPANAPLEVLPRVRVRKVLIRPTERPVREEVLLKVAWREREVSGVRGAVGLPPARWVKHGLTIALDLVSGRVCGFVRAEPGAQIGARDRWVTTLLDHGALVHGGAGQPCWAEADGAFELHGTLALLHAARGKSRPKDQPIPALPAAPQGVDASAFRELWEMLAVRA